MDNIETLTDILDNDGFDYIVLSYQRSKKGAPKIDAFIGIEDRRAQAEMSEALEEVYFTINMPGFRFRKRPKKKKD